YLDAGCTAQVTGVGVAAGTAVTRFHVRGTSAGNVTVTASSSGLSSASQSFVLLQPPPNQLVFRTPAQTLLAGACSAVARVESLDAFGNPSPAALDIGLAASPAPGLAFYADPDCTQPLALVSKPEGNSLADFYFKGTSAGAFTLAASSAGLTPATQPVTILPIVRSGTCNLPQTDTQTRCAVSPPLQDPSRAFFIFQAANVSASDTGSQANVRCTLGSNSYISCQRALKGTPVRIHWSLVERARGLRVQHLQATCAGPTTPVQFQPVVPEQTFLLLSSEGTDTSVQGGLKAALLTSATTAVIEKQGSCSPGETSSLQVVEYTGATVTRGMTSLNGLTTGVSAGGTDLSRSFLLFSYRASTSANPICTGAVRGELTGPGSIAFSRGFGNGNCDAAPINAIFWERVQLPPGHLVQQLSTTFSGSTRKQSVTLGTSVDTSRSFALSGGQWASGQTMGEGSCDSSESMEDMRARLELLSPNTVELTRETSCAQSRFTPFVIQLQP
ncbi:MAG TPA: hypothetical protein VK447_10220, partial [Myxococcaceae bacterium]|nr:hypothetical protein [Myxococcaceae bacterium]